MLQTLIRGMDPEWAAQYGLVIVDECHHLPAVAYTDAVRRIPARYWSGLTATPYRRDELDDLIRFQLGPVRHPSDGSLFISEDVTAGARGGRGHVWTVPYPP